MGTGLSSKHSKKNSDEERSKKRKMRSNKRRRHDSSSSSSYSSGTEIDAHSRKKRNQREPKKLEKMRKESKKSVKKKSRKSRYRRDASVSSLSSYSSWSCSTCRGRSSSSGRSRSRARGNKRVKLRGRSRSRSPPRADRKAKLRGRSRSSSPRARADRRVKSREKSRSKGMERGRSRRSLRRMSSKRDGGRYLSRNCSSCDRSRSSSSQSYSRSYSEGKGKEVDRPKRLKSALVVTKESEEMERLGSRSYSESQSHSEGRGKEVDQPRQLKSTLVVTKESEEMEGIYGRDNIFQACDDLGRSFDAYEQASDDRQVGFGGEKHATDIGVEDTAYVKGDNYVSTKLDTEPAKNADFGNYDSTRKNSGDAVNAGNSEPEDLELLLRQKALENFRKFRGGFLEQKGTSGDQKDESIQTEPCKDAGRFVEAKDTIVSSNCKSTSSLECQGSVQGGIPVTQPRIRSIINIPTENGDGNSIISCQNASESSRQAVVSIVTSTADGQTTPNRLKSKEESLDKFSSRKTLLAKDIQNEVVAEPGTSATIGDELKIADGSASGASACLNAKNKPVEEDTTGSHFEQKTFSRMHDGEMVQVSYKVYIPKKSSALARRQLQR